MRTTVEGAALVGFLSVVTLVAARLLSRSAPSPSSPVAGLAADSVVGTRLEAVLIMSTTTVGRLSGAFDRPFVVIGYTLAAVMMLAPLPNEIFIWIFPLWLAVVSSMMLIRRHRFPGPSTDVGDREGVGPRSAPTLP